MIPECQSALRLHFSPRVPFRFKMCWLLHSILLGFKAAFAGWRSSLWVQGKGSFHGNCLLLGSGSSHMIPFRRLSPFFPFLPLEINTGLLYPGEFLLCITCSHLWPSLILSHLVAGGIQLLVFNLIDNFFFHLFHCQESLQNCLESPHHALPFLSQVYFWICRACLEDRLNAVCCLYFLQRVWVT